MQCDQSVWLLTMSVSIISRVTSLRHGANIKNKRKVDIFQMTSILQIDQTNSKY